MTLREGETAVRIRIGGRVQGVWFRAWTAERAGALGLRGWVRNRRDGSVEALFAGPEALVEDMVAACREGPPGARVVRLERFAAEDDTSSLAFEQRPTI